MNPIDDLMDIHDLSKFSRFKERTIRAKLKGKHPIPHFKVDGKLIFQKSEYLKWMERYRVIERVKDAETVKEEITKSFKEPKI